MIIIQLDSVKKYRNQYEWRRVNRARAVVDGVEYEEVGDHAILQAICRVLVASGVSGIVEVRRGEMVVFSGLNVRETASGRINRGEQPEGLRKWRETQKP
jgi:hypothetical protein